MPRQETIRRLTATVLDRCMRLSRYSEERTKLTRTFLSAPMVQVHREVQEWMTQAGLTVRIDGIGNIIGRREGKPGAKTLLIGSHLDTVPDAGKYDGILGVMLGIAVAETLQAESTTLPFAIEVVGFSEEEGVRFSTPYLGSRAFIGEMNDVLPLKDRSGISVARAISAFGLKMSPIEFDKGQYLAYIEAHIEQGPVLEAAGQRLGIVSAIAGQSRRQVRFVGRAAHAGTTPMNLRHDALAAAAQWIGTVESMAIGRSGCVATVGQITVSPGGSNVIPGEATLSLDVRHSLDTEREALLAELLQQGKNIAQRRGVVFEVIGESGNAAAPMDARLMNMLREATGPDAPLMPSGAGHDAVILAKVMPAIMLFIRSPKGISHHPDEHVYAADLEHALTCLVQFIDIFAKGVSQ